MLVANLYLQTADDGDDTPTVAHVMSLCAVLTEYRVDVSLPEDFWLLAASACSAFLLLGVIIFLCSRSTANGLLRPLRELNDKMLEIMSSKAEVELNEEHQSSEDIAGLYTVFQELI